MSWTQRRLGSHGILTLRKKGRVNVLHFRTTCATIGHTIFMHICITLHIPRYTSLHVLSFNDCATSHLPTQKPLTAINLFSLHPISKGHPSPPPPSIKRFKTIMSHGPPRPTNSKSPHEAAAPPRAATRPSQHSALPLSQDYLGR